MKRRVYDSINVLIALGKIKKEKKWLSVQQSEQTQGREIILAKREKIEGIKKNNVKRQ